MEKPAKMHAKSHESYATFTVLSLVLPPIGLIVGIAYLCKKEPLDRKVGEHAVVMSVLGFVLSWLLLFKVFGLSFGASTLIPTASIPDSAGVTAATPAADTADVIAIKNSSAKLDALGLYEVTGEATNNGTAQHTMTLKATFYGASGVILGTASGALDQLDPGATKTFTMISSDKVSGYETMKVQVDSLF